MNADVLVPSSVCHAQQFSALASREEGLFVEVAGYRESLLMDHCADAKLITVLWCRIEDTKAGSAKLPDSGEAPLLDESANLAGRKS